MVDPHDPVIPGSSRRAPYAATHAVNRGQYSAATDTSGPSIAEGKLCCRHTQANIGGVAAWVKLFPQRY